MTAVERGAELPCATGRFTYDAAADKWDWDDEVFRVHGYAPGSVRPTTELVTASKHL